jgi:hypothetical protein
MPLQKVLVSNLSGEVIAGDTGARVRIMWRDPERPDMRIDLTTAETEKLAKQFKAEQVEIRPTHRGPRS